MIPVLPYFSRKIMNGMGDLMKLLDINDLREKDILQIWKGVSEDVSKQHRASIAWSFEGNGIRTRTSFIQ